MMRPMHVIRGSVASNGFRNRLPILRPRVFLDT